MDAKLKTIAEAAKGFMPSDEGLALYEAALAAPADLPLLEIGTYCGKSAVYLGAAARQRGTILFTIDHHRGSEEHQVGEEFHDPSLVDGAGNVDTLAAFRRTISDAGLDSEVVGIVAASGVVASMWRTPLALVFIDGGHSAHAATTDYEGWTPHIVSGGLLVIHDVFEDPAQGGRPPFDIWQRALASGAFHEIEQCRSLRVLEKVGDA